MPYFDVGERVRPGTFLLTSQPRSSSKNYYDDYDIRLDDDGYGNLRDQKIISSSFATSSYCQWYLTFNNEFRRFDDHYGLLGDGKMHYKLRKSHKYDADVHNVRMIKGVSLYLSESAAYKVSGMSGAFTESLNSHIRVPHDSTFEHFERCDQWGISLWINPNSTSDTGSLVSKGKVTKESYYDLNDKSQKIRTVEVSRPIPGLEIEEFNKFRTPIELSLIGGTIHYQASDGTNQLHISASAGYRDGWCHAFLMNSASMCKIYVNGTESGTQGPIPSGITSNKGDLILGSDSISSSLSSFNGDIAEVRMYDYIVSDEAIKSLANQDFYSGSLYQTNVVGNIFYKNGQAVISSPMPKYDEIFFTSSLEDKSISPIPTEFTASYKGQYTIYENECMVRVPKGTFNISMNPSSVFRPGTGIKNNCNTAGGGAEQTNGPGQFIKTMFISGSANPYITTIGLYNDRAQLLAIGKLAEPVQKRDDIDMNFVVRWDY